MEAFNASTNLTSDLVLMQADKAGYRDVSIAIGNSRLKRLEELLDAVDCLKSSLERRITDFRQRKPNRSLMDLPDELLVCIFEMTEPSLSQLMGWSLVCKKTRRITISIPSLWARQGLSTLMPPTTIDLIVTRSGTHKHYLNVESPLVPNDSITKHCHRWSRMYFDEKFKVSDLKLFQRIAPSSKLTSLHTLSLTASHPNIRVLNYEFNDDWQPTNLKHLDCTYTMPIGLAVSTLTQCHFDFDRVIDIVGLAALLASSPLLETLGISLGDMDGIDLDVDDQVEHLSLQNFSFTSYGADQNVVREFLLATSFPNVTSLSIDIQTGRYVDSTRASSSFRQVVEGIEFNFEGLKELDLKVDVGELDDDGFYDLFYMDEMFSHFPRSIESFSLAACDVSLRANSGNPYRGGTFSTFSKLRSIKFTGCNRLDTHFFEELADRFMKKKIRLDILEVQNCRSTNTNVDIKEDKVKMLFQDAGVLQA